MKSRDIQGYTKNTKTGDWKTLATPIGDTKNAYTLSKRNMRTPNKY